MRRTSPTGDRAATETRVAFELRAGEFQLLLLDRVLLLGERDLLRRVLARPQLDECLREVCDLLFVGGDEKTERLGRLMFGDLWEGADDGK